MIHSVVTERKILELRGGRNPVNPEVPGAFFVEPEATAAGPVEDVATLFLTNRECPFRCLYCDLWKNTTTTTVPPGAIPRQIDHALERLPAARHIKLYNSGNFFDAQAIPPDDHPEIARKVAQFQTVIVENHPRLTGPACVRFRDLLHTARREMDSHRVTPLPSHPMEFEVAMGLETVHPQILPSLNKQMTLDDFRRGAEYLKSHGIHARAFILLQPPYMPTDESVDWALRSLEFAFDCGIRVATVIPTRSGNGAVDALERIGEYTPPRLSQLEAVLERAIPWNRGRVFVDLWDAERFRDCPHCGAEQIRRLDEMNRRQTVLPKIGACPRPGCRRNSG